MTVPAWDELRPAIEASAVDVRVLPVDGDAGERTLRALRVTEASTLGALALHTGGLVLDHGWVRMLGAGAPGLPPLELGEGLLTVAYDVLGGHFAINGAALPGEPGDVAYWGPDSLSWTPIGGGHTTFVHWALGGGLADFYADLRWPGWEAESEPLALDHGIHVYPPPSTREGRDLGAASRRAVPFAELLDFNQHLAEQLGG